MNKVKALFVIALLLFGATTYAQTSTLKIGYTNVDYVLSQMPESRQIESDLKAYSAQLENQLKSKIEEYQRKEDAYKKGAATMTEVVRADKEKELINMQNSIAEFQRNADASLQKKQQSLLEPALEKLQKAIDDVANENGYTYVFNSDAGFGTTPILLHGPKDDDISDLVLKKMGVNPGAQSKQAEPAKPATTTPSKTTPAKKKK
ncbi:MAG: OmpH family outer membrane protein [Hymenobacteraceae bacterium]|nr:OmpH family outer membrane protein [Hymenobacteraceae bacterium]MDX5396544.1 OmpH family outer membrane protein [Hymenobacteraceae bacterium]MDX5443312.1 OmpH family outer membrane protein [Hymenobacteraceae bacterium]MDX5512608.1 OmpH family outer membrane protein [Hymenobacteraceae bacterium]